MSLINCLLIAQALPFDCLWQSPSGLAVPVGISVGMRGFLSCLAGQTLGGTAGAWDEKQAIHVTHAYVTLIHTCTFVFSLSLYVYI